MTVRLDTGFALYGNGDAVFSALAASWKAFDAHQISTKVEVKRLWRNAARAGAPWKAVR